MAQGLCEKLAKVEVNGAVSACGCGFSCGGVMNAQALRREGDLFPAPLCFGHFFAGVFPPAVAPEPEVWRVVDFLLEPVHVEFGHLEVGQELHVGGEALEVALVVAAARTGDVGKVGRRSHFLADAFGSGEDGRVLVEKLHPVVYADGSGALVGYEADVAALAFAAQAEDVAQGIVFGNVVVAETGAQMVEEAVEHGVAQGAVELSAGGGGPHAHGADPFPVAVVAEHEKHEGLLLEFGIHLLHAEEFHAALHFVGRDGEHLDGFDGVVAEEPVETPFDGPAFDERAVGEGVFEIVPYHAPAVAHHVVEDGHDEVGEAVEPPQGQARELV